MVKCEYCKKEIDEEEAHTTIKYKNTKYIILNTEYYCSQHCLDYGYILVGND